MIGMARYIASATKSNGTTRGEGGSALAISLYILPRQESALRLLVVTLLLFWPIAALGATKLFPERRPACEQCHGKNGVSQNPEVPSLGGMPEYYALLQLVAFREANRKDPVMSELVKDMTDDDLRAAAAWVARQPRPAAPVDAGDPMRMSRAQTLVKKNHCGQCHGPKFFGGEQMPPLARQREDYLLKSLRSFKAEKRLGDRAAMVEVLQPLQDSDLVELSYFMAHVH
jgi:cytochrome c553